MDRGEKWKYSVSLTATLRTMRINHGGTTKMLTVLVRFDTVLVRFTAIAVVANRGAP